MPNHHQGGCRCGAARYEIDLSGAHTLICHCDDCRQHIGAPFSVFTVVPSAQFHWLKKPEGRVTFSQRAARLFCERCGTYLKWEGVDSSDEAEINAMTLDTPALVTADEEIFTRSRQPWIKAVSGIPQFEAGRN
ncbi:GFA family protein [Kordiimonas sp.]|uniref:GFA family protein n=1 Tax=Kordiimonas sp. TaxID=1970157 RepID=UPI003A91DAFE